MDSSQKDQVSSDDDEPQIADNGCDNLGSQSHDNSISPGTKGFGLKKWRRIRRGVYLPKDTPSSASIDNSKILKRLLPANAKANANATKHFPINLPAKASIGSAFDGFPIPDFMTAAALDSENSEDRSSKSSTAASAPKPHAWDKNKLNTMPPNKSATSSQRLATAKAKLESSKRPRGERMVQIDKDNSQSSIESDSQSSNLFFMQGANATTNGRHTGRLGSYDGENSDEGHVSHQHFDDQVQTGYAKEKAGEVDDSQDGSAAEASWAYEAKSENKLVKSILSLQYVQEALVKEVQKLGEIGMEPILSIEKLMEDSGLGAKLADSSIQEPKPSSQLGSDETAQTATSSLQAKVLSLEKSVKLLECKLDEARTLLAEKESKVAELEAAMDSVKSPKEELSCSVGLQGTDDRELESELEDLFKQRIEAEIEYLAITRANQSLKVVAEKQATLFKEKVSVVEEQVVNKLGDVENKAAKLKKEPHELENYCSDILGTEEVLVSQRRVCKFTLCFCTQLVLLVLALWMFTSELSPNPDAVAPT